MISENSENYEEYLLDEDNSSEMKTSRHCCCYSLCCCCCWTDKEKSKKYYINKWRKYLSKESENTSAPFVILTNLWAHKNVISDLETIRLNPNLMSEKGLRNDLEFYIPQLCTFLIFGDYEVVEELLAFLCKACYASFFFAHRIIWFLKSLLYLTPMTEKIEYILQLIFTIFKSEKDKNKIERLHISNSVKYIDFIHKRGLCSFYTKSFPEINEDNLNRIQYEMFQVYKTSRNLIEMYSDRLLEYAEEVDDCKKRGVKYDKGEFQWGFFLQPDEIFISNFQVASIWEVTLSDHEESGSLKKEKDHLEEEESIAIFSEDDVNLVSFISSLGFIDELCSISQRMMELPQDKQFSFLRGEITKINKTLPGNVYIPFLKDSVRNYLVCHIPVSEIKIFRTKTRAPYMVTLELIRIDEIISEIMKKEKMKVRNAASDNDFSRDNLDLTQVVVDKLRSYSIGGPTPATQVRQKDIVPGDLTVSYGKSSTIKTFIMDNEDIKKTRRTTLMMLAESDIKLSKPMTISNLEAEKKRQPLRGVNKIIMEENEEYDESYVKQDMKDIVRRRYTALQKNKLNRYKTFCSRREPKIKLLEKRTTDHPIEIIRIKDQDEDIEEATRAHLDRFNSVNSVKSIDKDTKDVDIVEEIEKDHNVSEIVNLASDEYKTIFGEPIAEQAERLKKCSPFGHINTWRIFKAIVKSGEDLRQEQFATQLINEFHQIFQLEKIKCWVNPYEIIATGNNVGIIEMVPNSVSIDQLKKKIGNNSLRHFFENYFGPVSSKRFKHAMHNFINSLAGYSLVCYFLQLKDRHNANILLDNEGHLIHIDFGFLLSNAPGKGIKFESAPFKLTYETVECMGGVNSKYFSKFRKLLWKGFIALAKHYEKITILVEMMFCGHGKSLPCFQNAELTIDALKTRFCPRPNMTAVDYMKHVDSLIEQSIDNWRTNWYDKFQYYFQGIFY